MKNIAVFLFDGFSDWEISYLTPEINKSQQHNLIYCSENGTQVTSMGGLQVLPGYALSDVKPGEIDLLVLPGGTAWENSKNSEISPWVRKFYEEGKSLAAICAATIFLAQEGYLTKVKHTSNCFDYLKSMVPDYGGDKFYEQAWAVSDQNIITANGIASVEFAREVFRLIGLFTDDRLEKWFQLFKNGIWSD